MSALDRLCKELSKAGTSSLSLSVGGDLPELILSFKKQKGVAGMVFDEDVVKKSVLRFWQEQKFESLREAQLVSYGLTIKPESSTPCILEDRERFRAVLDQRGGVGQWLDSPRWFRRCYQGLVSSYFTYDGRDPQKPSDGRKNWGDLRDYLWQGTNCIVDLEFNMAWVDTATKNRSLFSRDPCMAYANAALAGDTAVIDEITNELGVSQNSWFHWELIMAQVRHATSLSDDVFKGLISNLLALISGNELVRDKAMIAILDRYAQSDQPALHVQLRDAAVSWWGNPWLPSDEVRWGGVQRQARELVAEWLRGDFIEAFFAKLAKDGVGDRRRADFWLRYVKSMSDVRFGLGASALDSRDRDFAALREKMKGLFSKLEDPVSTNNAFIMTIGNLVAVEFGGQSNAFYGYDRRKVLPFEVREPLRVPVGAHNSLKHDEPVRVLRMSHKDGILGFSRWEDMFEAELKSKFGINRDSGRSTNNAFNKTQSLSGLDARERQPKTLSVPTFSDSALEEFVSLRGIRVRDNRWKSGNLRVETHDSDLEVNRILLGWGFKYNETGTFWWKKQGRN
jgi:hypothetical protein